ncbi:MAG: DUF2807 domain-containing protein [Bacteroidales bacterium]|nr:DUF2807 domain-containing protein [Bacteroidales bacterium]
MKKLLFIALSAIFLCSSCNINISTKKGVSCISYSEEGADYTETRTPGVFEEIRTSGPFNLYYVQGPEYKVVVEGKKEFVDRLVTEMDGDDLSIYLEKGKYGHLVLRVTVYAPQVEKISMAGSGNLFDMGGHVSNDDVKYSNAGSGNINVASLKCKEFEAIVAGCGNVKVGSIVAKEAEFKAAGSTRISVGELVADDVEMEFSGSGNARIEKADVAGELKLSISGAGDITVNGKAGRVNVRISGAGNIGGKLEYGSISIHKSGAGDINFN